MCVPSVLRSISVCWQAALGRLPIRSQWIGPLVMVWLLASSYWNLAATSARVRPFWLVGSHPNPQQRQIDALLASVPPAASVAATDTLNPHLSDRYTLFLLPDPQSYTADYVAIDLPDAASTNQQADQQMYEAMLTSGSYRVVGTAGQVVLLQRLSLLRRSVCTSVRNERCCMLQRVHLPNQLPAVADRVLVRQTLAGDQGAFETLVRRYHVQVFHCIRHYVSDDDQAWDVFQQVLLKLSMSLPTLCTAGEQLGPWLFRVARNCCIDELRRRRMVRFSELGWEADADMEERLPLASLVDPGPSPEETVEHHEVQCVLREAIEGLPPRLRPVVLLRYTDQLSFAEIGQRLKMPASTAKSYFYRARPLLRASLTAQGHTDLPAGEHLEGRLLRMTKQT
jgi:RNA polymerase sigma-70 factor (ECF subfamily)